MTESIADTRWRGLQEAIDAVPSRAEVAVTAIDIDSGETFSVHGTERFKAASTIKTLILATLAHAVDAGKVDLDERLALPESLKVGGSGVLNWLTTGIELPLRDYAWLMITISDNTASNVCIDAVGLATIQQFAQEIGLPEIVLGRYFRGISPQPGDPDNFTTSDALAQLVLKIETGAIASAEPTAWMRTLLAEQQHRNRLPRILPDEVTYAGKTGSINGHVHDCGILTGPRGRIAIAALSRNFGDSYAAESWLGKVGRQAALTLV